MFSVRLLEKDDYYTLVKWWKWHRFPAPASDCLPNDGKGGVMISKEGVDIAAGFLYFTNSNLCWLEFIVSNPEYRADDRAEGIQRLIHELTRIAKNNGFKAVFTSVKNQNLIKHYEICGFTKGSNNTHEMIAVL